MKIKLIVLSLALSTPVFASLDNASWSLNKGSRHSKFIGGKGVKSLEAEVFSELVPFQERWKLVSKVAEMKSPKFAELFLIRCLESNKWFLQSSALKLLQKRNPELSIFYANKLLQNAKALVVRSEAVDVLAALGGPNHTQVLWQALKQQKNFMGTKSLWIRPQIVKAILKLERSNHSRREWGLLLRDSDKQIKELAQKVTDSF